MAVFTKDLINDGKLYRLAIKNQQFAGDILSFLRAISLLRFFPLLGSGKTFKAEDLIQEFFNFLEELGAIPSIKQKDQVTVFRLYYDVFSSLSDNISDRASIYNLLLEGMRICMQIKGKINLIMNSSLWRGDLYDEFAIWQNN